MGMKVIFLDIDGVLNNPGSYSKITTDIGLIERYLVNKLNKIIESTEAVIVLSSTWKYKFKRIATAHNFLILACGIKTEIIGFTPNLKNATTGDEIAAFFKKHNTEKVKSFIVLDDSSSSFISPYSDRHIKVNGAFGLSDENVEQAIKLLNG